MFLNKDSELISYHYHYDGCECKGGKTKTPVNRRGIWNHNYSTITFITCLPCYTLSWFFNLFYCIISTPIIFITNCCRCNLIKATCACCPKAINQKDHICTCVLNGESVTCCPCIEPILFIIFSVINLVLAIISDVIVLLVYILSCGCFCYYCKNYGNYKSCCYHVDQVENIPYEGFPNYAKMLVSEV